MKIQDLPAMLCESCGREWIPTAKWMVDKKKKTCSEECRRSLQGRNGSGNVGVPITHPVTGETMIIQDWAKRIGISPNTLSRRMRLWPLEEALSLDRQKLSRFRRGLVLHGIEVSVSDLIRISGRCKQFVAARLARGMSPEEIIVEARSGAHG